MREKAEILGIGEILEPEGETGGLVEESGAEYGVLSENIVTVVTSADMGVVGFLKPEPGAAERYDLGVDVEEVRDYPAKTGGALGIGIVEPGMAQQGGEAESAAAVSGFTNTGGESGEGIKVFTEAAPAGVFAQKVSGGGALDSVIEEAY